MPKRVFDLPDEFLGPKHSEIVHAKKRASKARWGATERGRMLLRATWQRKNWKRRGGPPSDRNSTRRQCALCLYRVGLGVKIVGRMVRHPATLIARWVRIAGIRETGRANRYAFIFCRGSSLMPWEFPPAVLEVVAMNQQLKRETQQIEA